MKKEMSTKVLIGALGGFVIGFLCVMKLMNSYLDRSCEAGKCYLD